MREERSSKVIAIGSHRLGRCSRRHRLRTLEDINGQLHISVLLCQTSLFRKVQAHAPQHAPKLCCG